MDKIHIGQMIQAVLEEQGRTMKWFAKNIHCDYSNAYKILKRENMDLNLLITISKILNHDFFLDISKAIQNDTS